MGMPQLTLKVKKEGTEYSSLWPNGQGALPAQQEILGSNTGRDCLLHHHMYICWNMGLFMAPRQPSDSMAQWQRVGLGVQFPIESHSCDSLVQLTQLSKGFQALSSHK